MGELESGTKKKEIAKYAFRILFGSATITFASSVTIVCTYGCAMGCAQSGVLLVPHFELDSQDAQPFWT